MLEVKNLSKMFAKKQALNDISFNIERGEVVGFVGPNGSGKTTTMKCCVGLLKKTHGEVVVDGCSLDKDYEKALAKMALMLDNSAFYEYMSAYDNLKLYSKIYGIKDVSEIDAAIEKVGLGARKKDLVKRFSLGMKQRLSLANCMLKKPQIIFMDEPLNGLDAQAVLEVKELLKDISEKQGVSVLISSHNLHELSKICSRTIAIKNGELVKDFSALDDKMSEVTFKAKIDDELLKQISDNFGVSPRVDGDNIAMVMEENKVNDLIAFLVKNNIVISNINCNSTIERKYTEFFGGNKIG